MCSFSIKIFIQKPKNVSQIIKNDTREICEEIRERTGKNTAISWEFLGREPYSEWVEPMASFMFNQNTAELLFYAQNERV